MRGVVHSWALFVIAGLMIPPVGCDREQSGSAPPQQQQVDSNTPDGQARALIQILTHQTMNERWAEGEQTIKQLNDLKPKTAPEVQQEIEAAINSYTMTKVTAVVPGESR